jgi:hypothetical protein
MTVGKTADGNGNGNERNGSGNGDRKWLRPKRGDRLTYDVKPKTETAKTKRLTGWPLTARTTMTGRPLTARDNDENGNE